MESRFKLVVGIACLIACAACGNKLQTREAVERGIRKGVAQRGLNLDAMDLQIQNVNFHDNKADATVGFFPKGGQLSQGMTMHYKLEQRDNEWVIVGRSQSDMHQHSDAPAMGGPEMGAPIPPGAQGQSGSPLPAGHPSVGDPPK